MARNRLESFAETFQDYLERLKVSEYSRFNKLMQELQRNVIAAINSGDFDGMTRLRIERLLRDLRRINLAAYNSATEAHMERLASFAQYSYEIEAAALATYTTAPSVRRARAAAAFAAALERPLGATGDLLEPFVRGLGPRQVDIIERTIRKAHANGWTAAEATRVIRGTARRGYKDGLMVKLGNQTATVVRTAWQHVNITAREQVWAENEDIVKGYRWVSTLDSKTSPVCQDLDGEVFPIGKGPLPPAHPNCRSTTVAELDSRFDFLDRGATRSSEEGYVRASLTYADWLAGKR